LPAGKISGKISKIFLRESFEKNFACGKIFPKKILERAGKLFFAEGAGPLQNILAEGPAHISGGGERAG
jgi:hypothetical protein